MLTVTETILAVVVIVAATVTAIVVGDVPPVLAGILGVALGYVAKGAATTAQWTPRQKRQEPFSGAPEG